MNTATQLRALADKAIRNVGFFGRMTELTPEDVRLLQNAAEELERKAVREEVERIGAAS
jgi:hypothetical protein